MQNEKTYEKPVKAVTVTGDLINVIGEATIEHDGKNLDIYIYNIVDYTPQNGKPFMARKENVEFL